MAQPPIKRYVLVPREPRGGVQRFHLARLERMEEVAAREQDGSGGLDAGVRAADVKPLRR